MLLDRTHTRWAVLSGLLLAAGSAAWVACAWNAPNGNSGGSVPGLLFGIAGTLMMFFAGLLGARRPLRHRRLGSASFWLKGHLWLGTLCIPFLLFHASFALGGLLEQLLWFCLFFVAVSGFFGLAIHQFLPRLLSRNVPLESFEPQSPWLCDRMTLTADIRTTAACERTLPEISPHLLQTARSLVRRFDDISASSESRGEKNARKLLMMQQLTPADHRDFFWTMAKFSKAELKAITFEGDFPDVLAKIYQNLREIPPQKAAVGPPEKPAPAPETPRPTNPAIETRPTAPSLARTTAPPTAQSAPAQPNSTQPVTDKGTTDAGTAGLSPIEIMKRRQAEAAAAASTSNEKPVATADTSAAPAPKLSPLELMKQKAAEKAAAAAAAANASKDAPATTPDAPVAHAQATPESTTAATTAPAPKLSPLELMKQKAAEKAAAAANAKNDAPATTPEAPAAPAQATPETTPAATTPPTPKLSPLELMKQKAAEKAAAAAAAANAKNDAPATTPEAPAAPAKATPEATPAATAAPAPKLSPLELMKQKAAEKAAVAAAAANAKNDATATTPDAPAAHAQPTPEAITTATTAPAPKLSPLELMKQKAAERAAAAAATANAKNDAPATTPDAPAAPAQPTPEATTTATSAPAPKLSPLELMKQKAAEKASVTPTTGSYDPPTLTPQPATVKTPVAVAKPGTPPVAKPPLPPGSATPAPPAKSVTRAPSPEDRQILWTFYTQTVRPFLATTQSAATVRRSPLMSDVDAGRQFREVQASLPVAHQELLNELQHFCNVRRQIEQQRTILRWMHWWLALHIPASLLLIVFTLAHIVMALRVVPFRF